MSAPSAIARSPYVLACLRTNAAGRARLQRNRRGDRHAPSSSPASTSVSGGNSGAESGGDVGEQHGIGLESVLVEVLGGDLTRANVKVPVSRAIELTRAASEAAGGSGAMTRQSVRSGVRATTLLAPR